MVERKNITILEMAKTMLSDYKISDRFYSQVVSIVVHIPYRGLLRVNTRKNIYNVWNGKPTHVKYFRVFGIKCSIIRDDENI